MGVGVVFVVIFAVVNVTVLVVTSPMRAPQYMLVTYWLSLSPRKADLTTRFS